MSAFKEAFLKAICPPPKMTVSEWSDQYRMLPSKTSSEPGKWRTSRTPYLKEIMDELSHMSKTKEVVFKKASQVGGTEAGNNFIGYAIDYMPSTIMVVWPSLPDVKKNSKLRIDPLISETPQLREKTQNLEKNEKQDNALFKGFSGGALILTGANSASGLRSVPAKYLFLDEIDGYPDDVEGEGDPISLVQVRTRTFPRRKIFKCSTPTIKGKSKISREFEASDQRYYHVPCPHCGEKQKLEFDNLKYETEIIGSKTVVRNAIYYCEHCGVGIEEHYKPKMLDRGEWIAENKGSDIAGFHLSALYSPLGWYSWKEMAQEWVDAQGNPDLMVSFTNTALGMEYEEAGDMPQDEALYDRREPYAIGSVPNGVILLTCGVDVQGDRLEAEVHGWGRYRERWVIDRKVITGKPQEDSVWDELEEYITSSFKRVDGRDMVIKRVGIDSGYETSRVYSFCRRFSKGSVVPLKGQDTLAQPIAMPKAVDVKESGKTNRRGLKLWRVGTNYLKAELFGDLKKEEPKDLLESYPSGFIHYPEFEMEYFKQLVSEKRVIEKDSKGYSKIVWKKIRERNETLDLHVYNRAVVAMLGYDKMKDEHYDKLESEIGLVSKIKTNDNNNEKLSRREKRRRKREGRSWL